MQALRHLVALTVTAMLFAVGPASADNYPEKPIHIVVPFTAGGGTDTITRMVAEKLQAALGQPVIIENRPGGNTIIGAQAVATAPADGYTLLSTLDMTMTILPAVYSKLPFDPEKDFAPVSLLAHVPALFVAHPSVPAETLKELVEYSKANPGQLNYGSAVLYGQVLGQQLKSVSGMNYTYIPYKGAPEAMQSLLGGNIDFMMLDIATGLKFIEDGKLKALAITSPKRHPELPDVPTVGELGYPQLNMKVWYAMYAPAGTPASVVARLNSELVKALAMPDVKARLADLGHDAASSTPQEVTALIEADAAKWAKAAKEGGIKLD